MGRKASMGRMAAAGIGGLWLLAALAPAHAGALNRSGTPEDVALFSATYRAITSHYLKPITADRLALAGLSRLDRVDPTLSVARENGRVVLRQWRDLIWERPAPAADDNAGWGRVTAAILDTARHYSRDVAADPVTQLDATVIDGGLALLDRFSRYAPPAQAVQRRDSRDGYGGIGVTLDRSGATVRIAMVLPDSPAATAGLEGGDVVTAINGVTATKLGPEQIADRMRGQVGTSLRLTVARADHAGPLTVTLRRSRIVLKSVSMARRGDIAVFHVTSFNARTADDLADAVAAAHREMGADLRGLVLDLRGNPGGLVDQSVRVASLFLRRGRVVSTRGRVPDSNQIFDVTRDRPAEILPLVVLVNGGSASASEIVASALQDDHRAVIVGTSSYGKGTVQDVIHLPNQGELTVTWAKLIPPGGYILHHHGVVPVVCTDNLVDAAQAVPVAGVPRAGLDDNGWTALRAQCPPERVARNIDLEVAERLLNDPTRYAQALADEPAKPIQAAMRQPLP